MTTFDKTQNIDPNSIITIYRGTDKKYKQKQINPGDFVTTNKELAKSYSGDGNVLSMKVKASEIMDDIDEPGGEEYLYVPNYHKIK